METTRIQPPKLILGNFYGVETGLRQLIRSKPLETESVEFSGKTLTIPTKGKMLRIKAWLIVIRNTTRDYIDFAAISHILGYQKVVDAVSTRFRYAGASAHFFLDWMSKWESKPNPPPILNPAVILYQQESNWDQYLTDACSICP